MPMFDKRGNPTLTRFRVYCDHEGCKNYLMGKWGGGYGCIETKEGMFDSRNQVWLCDEHCEKKFVGELRINKEGKINIPEEFDYAKGFTVKFSFGTTIYRGRYVTWYAAENKHVPKDCVEFRQFKGEPKLYKLIRE